MLIIDEFPYLVETDKSLPSRMQRFIDHDLRNGQTILLSGSVESMMHSLFLDRHAPLFGRTKLLMNLQPMDFTPFCEYFSFQPTINSFEKFSLVGGVPAYWQLLKPKKSTVDNVQSLFFNSFSPLGDESSRMLSDKGVNGQLPKDILMLIGRGAHKPSEIASRLGMQQGALTRPLRQLRDSGYVEYMQVNAKNSLKKSGSLYHIVDPFLRFYFTTVLPHRDRFEYYDLKVKMKLIHDHAAKVFENYVRTLYPGSTVYCDRNCEIDIYIPPKGKKKGLVAEIKFRELTSQDRRRIKSDLEKKVENCGLASLREKLNYEVIGVEIFDIKRVYEISRSTATWRT